MNDFNYYTPTKIVFGKDTETRIADLVREFGGTKVLIHYGGGSVIKSGLLVRVKKALASAGIPYTELGGVVPNPRLSLVREGIAKYNEEKADFILAVGGGSVIDSSKAIGYGVMYGGDVWDLYSHKGTAKASAPVGVILTLAASGSEMSDSSVITNEDGQRKCGYNSDLCRPKFAILDPQLTTTLPAFQTACGCSDIIMHTLERWFTSSGNMELTDGIAAALIRTVMHNASILLEDPMNYDARAEVMWAGSLSHNGLTGCGNGGNDFATHRIEHEVSGIYDVAHGAGLTALWGSWARYVLSDCTERFHKFAVDIMGIEDDGSPKDVGLKGIEMMEAFFSSIDMPISLHELGIDPTDAEMQLMAAKCAASTGGHIGAAKVLYEDDFLAIYRMAARA